MLGSGEVSDSCDGASLSFSSDFLCSGSSVSRTADLSERCDRLPVITDESTGSGSSARMRFDCLVGWMFDVTWGRLLRSLLAFDCATVIFSVFSDRVFFDADADLLRLDAEAPLRTEERTLERRLGAGAGGSGLGTGFLELKNL